MQTQQSGVVFGGAFSEARSDGVTLGQNRLNCMTVRGPEVKGPDSPSGVLGVLETTTHKNEKVAKGRKELKNTNERKCELRDESVTWGQRTTSPLLSGLEWRPNVNQCLIRFTVTFSMSGTLTVPEIAGGADEVVRLADETD